jgi:hypothetical protein
MCLPGFRLNKANRTVSSAVAIRGAQCNVLEGYCFFAWKEVSSKLDANQTAALVELIGLLITSAANDAALPQAGGQGAEALA